MLDAGGQICYWETTVTIYSLKMWRSKVVLYLQKLIKNYFEGWKLQVFIYITGECGNNSFLVDVWCNGLKNILGWKLWWWRIEGSSVNWRKEIRAVWLDLGGKIYQEKKQMCWVCKYLKKEHWWIYASSGDMFLHKWKQWKESVVIYPQMATLSCPEHGIYNHQAVQLTQTF